MSSQVERAIINASAPIELRAGEAVNVNGVKGVVVNQHEFANVKNIAKYRLNQDSNPQIIRKKPAQRVQYTQEVAVRYLKPPAGPAPGKLIIRQQPDVQTPAAPPLVIRQGAQKPQTPAPLVIREAPPKAPAPIPEQVITVPGKVLPAPPRKVVIEKLPPVPAKPQNVILERWLPYEKQKRQVVFEKPCQQAAPLPAPRNVVIEWEAPCVTVNKQIRNLGVVEANPEEYRSRYNFTRSLSDLPSVVREIPRANAAAQGNNLPELEGDVEALRLVDLERHNLSGYRSLVGASSASASASASRFSRASSVSASIPAASSFSRASRSASASRFSVPASASFSSASASRFASASSAPASASFSSVSASRFASASSAPASASFSSAPASVSFSSAPASASFSSAPASASFSSAPASASFSSASASRFASASSAPASVSFALSSGSASATRSAPLSSFFVSRA